MWYVILKVNHNVGEVATMNLTNSYATVNSSDNSITRNYKSTAYIFTSAGLSNHKTIEEMDSNLSDLDTKGYIFPIRFAGYSGVFWNNDHTCTPIIVDDDNNVNEYCIAYGRTHDKAVRSLTISLLPQVKSTQLVDKSTGLLPTGIVKDLEGIGDKALGKMEKAGEISSGKTIVDASSNLLVSPRELKVGFKLQPTGTIDVITGTINLKTAI